MIVYADILILVNFTVDYFLLLLAARFLHKKTKLHRLLLGAAAGGAFSLYIFLPQSNFFVQSAVQILMCAALCLISFGFGGIKAFFKNVAVLFCVNFAYSGAMIAVWLIFKPYGMAINNSVVYFNISPLFLILFSVLGYIAVSILRRVLENKFPQNTSCEVTVLCAERALTLIGIADTGNSLDDVFGLSRIFITEAEVVDALVDCSERKTRYRAVPCSTVTGTEILDGYRIDGAEILYKRRKYTFKSPVLAVSREPLDGCKIIVNPEIFN